MIDLKPLSKSIISSWADTVSHSPAQNLTTPALKDEVCGQKESKYPQNERQTKLDILSDPGSTRACPSKLGFNWIFTGSEESYYLCGVWGFYFVCLRWSRQSLEITDPGSGSWPRMLAIAYKLKLLSIIVLSVLRWFLSSFCGSFYITVSCEMEYQYSGHLWLIPYEFLHLKLWRMLRWPQMTKTLPKACWLCWTALLILDMHMSQAAPALMATFISFLSMWQKVATDIWNLGIQILNCSRGPFNRSFQ